MNYEMINKTSFCLASEPADQAGSDTKSNLIDTQGFESLMVLAIVGALTGVDASNYVTPILQESDTTDDADFSAVAAADMVGDGFSKIDAAAEDSVIQSVAYVGTKRYVRVLFDYTGTGITAGIAGAIGVANHGRVQPAADITPVSAT